MSTNTQQSTMVRCYCSYPLMTAFGIHPITKREYMVGRMEIPIQNKIVLKSIMNLDGQEKQLQTPADRKNPLKLFQTNKVCRCWSDAKPIQELVKDVEIDLNTCPYFFPDPLDAQVHARKIKYQRENPNDSHY